MTLPTRLLDGALERIAARLLDDLALGRHQQCRLQRHRRDRAAQGADDEAKNDQQHDEVQEPAQHIQAAPQPVQNRTQEVHGP